MCNLFALLTLFFVLCFLSFQVFCLLVCAVEYVANGFNISCIQVHFSSVSHKSSRFPLTVGFVKIVQAGIPDYWPIPAHVMNTYCYVMSTFTLPRSPSPPSLQTAGTSLARLISQFTQGWESTMQETRRLWTLHASTRLGTVLMSPCCRSSTSPTISGSPSSCCSRPAFSTLPMPSSSWPRGGR